MSGVVVVGSVNADLLARVDAHPAPGQTVLGDSLSVLAGGKGANQAVAAALLGARVALVGAVGGDTFAQAATANLSAAGVDLSALDVVDGPTGIAMITVAADGENSIVVLPGANGSVDAAAVGAHEAVVADADVVVLQCEIPRSGVEAAARTATGRVVLNLAPVVALDPDVVRLADPLVVNEHEALGALRILHGEAPTTAQGAGGGSDPGSQDHARLARDLVGAGVPSVVVTLGGAGALVATRQADGLEAADVVAVPAPRVSTIDTTGAGDAFVGALAHRLAVGDELVAAARVAARVGAYAVTGNGAQPSYPAAHDALPQVS